MKSKFILLLVPMIIMLGFIEAQTIWTGTPITFTKAANANPATNQDAITSNVTLTRGNSGGGLYNAVTETSYSNGLSPDDTEWALGNTSNIGALTFFPFNSSSIKVKSNLGQPMVLHLITDDIYIDVVFNSWSVGSNSGGQVSYTRSTDPNSFKLKLLSFDVSSEVQPASASWEVESGDYFDRFELQESNDAIDFYTIASIEATEQTKYQHSFDLPKSALAYYRLKVVDKSGEYEYSSTQKVEVPNLEYSLGEFYPNPNVAGHRVISYFSDHEGRLECEVINAVGARVLMQERQLQKGMQDITFDFSTLQSGVYFVNFKDKLRCTQRKIIVSN